MIGSLSEPPKNAHPAFRYIQLVVALALFVAAIYLRLTALPAYQESWNREPSSSLSRRCFPFWLTTSGGPLF